MAQDSGTLDYQTESYHIADLFIATTTSKWEFEDKLQFLEETEYLNAGFPDDLNSWNHPITRHLLAQYSNGENGKKCPKYLKTFGNGLVSKLNQDKAKQNFNLSSTTFLEDCLDDRKKMTQSDL